MNNLNNKAVVQRREHFCQSILAGKNSFVSNQALKHATYQPGLIVLDSLNGSVPVTIMTEPLSIAVDRHKRQHEGDCQQPQVNKQSMAQLHIRPFAPDKALAEGSREPATRSWASQLLTLMQFPIAVSISLERITYLLTRAAVSIIFTMLKGFQHNHIRGVGHDPIKCATEELKLLRWRRVPCIHIKSIACANFDYGKINAGCTAS